MKLGPILLISCCCCNLSIIIAVIIYVIQTNTKAKKEKETIQKAKDDEKKLQDKEIQAKAEAKVQAKSQAEAEKLPVKWQPKNVNKIVHRRTNKCVDSDGKDIYGRSCGSDYQKWEFDNGVFKHVMSENCLSFNNDEQKVIMSTCDGNDRFQKWTHDETLIKNNVTGRCLDGDGEKIYTSYCDTNNNFQQWDISKY